MVQATEQIDHRIATATKKRKLLRTFTGNYKITTASHNRFCRESGARGQQAEVNHSSEKAGEGE